ncbi:MAG: F0F1 ATP synthase subunit delta [Candidatus Uhrbacteria bacterium]|nr:F0F1 ATP synthase subunit delta [Candidatus Uhrbacteria bacterium]
MKKESAKLVARALQLASHGKKKSEVDALVESFVLERGSRGHMKFLTAVSKELTVLVEREKGIEHIECRLAHVSEKEAKGLITAISKKLKKDVEATVTEDPSLIAGAVVTFGDTRIDGSLKARLAQLEHLLQ